MVAFIFGGVSAGSHTICSFTVLPSNSIVLIFCLSLASVYLPRVVATYEVDADSGDVGLSVGVVCESQEQTGLSNTGISDKEELEEVIVSGRIHVSIRMSGTGCPGSSCCRHVDPIATVRWL